MLEWEYQVDWMGGGCCKNDFLMQLWMEVPFTDTGRSREGSNFLEWGYGKVIYLFQICLVEISGGK